MKLEMCSIVAVSPLVSVFRYLVEQLKQLAQELGSMKNSRKITKQRERASVG